MANPQNSYPRSKQRGITEFCPCGYRFAWIFKQDYRPAGLPARPFIPAGKRLSFARWGILANRIKNIMQSIFDMPFFLSSGFSFSLHKPCAQSPSMVARVRLASYTVLPVHHNQDVLPVANRTHSENCPLPRDQSQRAILFL